MGAHHGQALNVVMLGPPGAGKGTQAERLARRFQLPKISTGDILREAVQARTPLGCVAKATMDAGNLVGDDVMIGIVQERLDRDDARRGFVLDGFPRTVVQATALDLMVDGRGPLVVLDIVVPEDVLAHPSRVAAHLRAVRVECRPGVGPGMSEVRRRAHHARRRRRSDRPRAVEGVSAADQAARRVLLAAIDIPRHRRQPAA